MASSSRPFESQTVSRLMAGYRSLQHGAKTLFLRGRLALLWGVQVAVFPAYVAFQSIRTGYRRLQSKHPWQALNGLLTGKPVQEIPVTADTPIRALLSAIQPQMSPKAGWLRPVNYHGAFLRQSHAGGVLTNGSWHLVPVQEPIRGIASDVVTRKLVLVTVSNSVFEELTEDQQSRLERAIALVLVEYAATLKHRQWEQNLVQTGLPLPKAEPNQWRIVRWLSQGMRWMQTGGLAAVTNLFGEAEQSKRLQFSEGQSELLRKSIHREPISLPASEDLAWLEPGVFVPADIGVVASPSEATDLLPEILVSEDSSVQVDGDAAGVRAGGLSSMKQFSTKMADAAWPLEIDTIEARVSRVDYIDSWFGQLLRWIDQGLLWLERSAKRLWNWLRPRG